MTKKKAAWLISTILFASYCFSPSEQWDGRYPRIECRLKVLDTNENPIQHVKLNVYNDYGNLSYKYPVAEFTEQHSPSSNENGVIIFHQTKSGLQFGGLCTNYLGLIEIGRCDPPDYYLIFLLNEREIYTLRFVELNHNVNQEDLHTITINHNSEGSDGSAIYGEFPVITKEIIIK